MTEASQPATTQRTILVVDDDERVRKTFTILFRWASDWLLVGEASDCAMAFDLAVLHHPQLILLDRWLPDGDGLDLLPRLRALEPPPLVVVITGDPSAESRDQALAAGAGAYLSKTTPPFDLLQELRTVCDASKAI